MFLARFLFCCFVLFHCAECQEPNPPSWPNSVYVLDPASPSESQKVVDQIFEVNGGHNPAFHGQFSPYRFALLFMPGVHNVSVDVGYYTSVIGLGQSPLDTNISAVTCQNGDFDYKKTCYLDTDYKNNYSKSV